MNGKHRQKTKPIDGLFGQLHQRITICLKLLVEITHSDWAFICDKYGQVVGSESKELNVIPTDLFLGLDLPKSDDERLEGPFLLVVPEEWQSKAQAQYLVRDRLPSHPVWLCLGFLDKPSISKLEVEFRAALNELGDIFDEVNQVLELARKLENDPPSGPGNDGGLPPLDSRQWIN